MDDRIQIAAAILQHGAHLAASDRTGVNGVFTADSEANRLLVDDPFAFLVGVIVDYQMPAERAWTLPYKLKRRLNGWGATYVANHPEEVEAAFKQSPKLHRFPTQTPRFVVAGAERVLADYGGDAAAIWSDEPKAADLQQRFRAFMGISQKKAAMAVEILERDLGVKVSELSGSDVAYDVHLRRVMLRTRLATDDTVAHMVGVARSLHPTRPGELDFPLWDIGRQWCHKQNPECAECVLAEICPQDVAAGNFVRGA
ncbi:MAG: hypothetical protein O3B42_10240 [Actinomycetota bacterium]|nr:hypothetical protein [Actinomycetota bacterium]